MRPFILFKSCQKFSIQLNRSGKKVFLHLLVMIISCDIAQADTVQRWQDNHGQWHFGDQAAAIGLKTQPVLIKNPISVIQNDQPQPTKNQHKQQCNTLREQVYGQPVAGKASQLRQNLVRQYEQNCISGNYYGD